MTEFNYGAVRSAEEFETFVERLLAADKPFGFDIESGFIGDTKDKNVALKFRHPDWVLVGFSFTNSEEWARYVPVAHDNGDNVDDPVRAARALWKLLNSGKGVAHNALFELGALSRWFRDTIGEDADVKKASGFYPVLSDSMIEAFLTGRYHPTFVGQGLKGLTKHVFDHQMTEFNSLFDDLIARKVIKTTEKRFNILDLTPEVISYACEDALWCLKLHNKHMRILEKMPVYDTVYTGEIALLRVVAEMEYEGLLLNWHTISAKAKELTIFRDLMNEEIQQELSDILDETININLGSVKQLKEVLFDKIGIEPNERHKSEKTGEPSTSVKALGAIVGEHPIIKRILKYRNVNKLLGSYLNKYENELNYAGDGRAYPNHKQTGTRTGRFSVDGVSYQQWPKPYHFELKSGREFDLNFRDLLISPVGSRIVGFDFSQVELRVLAGAAREVSMIRAFESGTDIHTATASTMLGVPVDEVTAKDRQVGKTLNFAIVYGSGAAGIADLIGCTQEEAQGHLDNYFQAFPGIKRYMDEQVSNGHAKGYVDNLFGRRTRVWEFLDTRNWMIAAGERFCGNAPIQGGAGDYLKIGMIRAHKAIAKAGLADKIKMVVTFHDALEFYVDSSVSTQELIDLIGPAVSFPIPGFPEIRADWHEGYQWGSIAEISLTDGKVAGYELSVLLPDESKHEWSGDTVEEALTPYYYWCKSHYGDTYNDLEFFLHRVPEAREFVPSTVVEEVVEVEDVPEVKSSVSALVTLSEMPSRGGWEKFQGWLKDRPGATEVTLVTPDGQITFDEKHTILPKDRNEISYMLGGARLDFPNNDLSDLADLMEDIEL